MKALHSRNFKFILDKIVREIVLTELSTIKTQFLEEAKIYFSEYFSGYLKEILVSISQLRRSITVNFKIIYKKLEDGSVSGIRNQNQLDLVGDEEKNFKSNFGKAGFNILEDSEYPHEKVSFSLKLDIQFD